MTTKTGEGLAQYALAQLGRPYWWGTFGQTASAALLAQKRAQYPEYYTADDFKSQFGQRVHDCVGLIKGYLWSETPKSTPVYCAEQDVAVSGLYRSCVRRGDIARMPQITGACVFMEGLGHVGVYVGDGYVVEASGHAKGVVRTRLKDRGWALWGLPGWISYGDAPADWAQGAAVAEVVADSPAEQSGLQVNDIITAVNGTAITGSTDLVNTVKGAAIGDELTLSVYRQGKEMELTLTVGEKTQDALPQTDSTQSSQDNSQQQQQDGQQYGYSYGQGGFPFNFFN